MKRLKDDDVKYCMLCKFDGKKVRAMYTDYGRYFCKMCIDIERGRGMEKKEGRGAWK